MTPDPAQLPHLLDLLDDESPTVQEAVWHELKAYGQGLEEELARQNLSLEGRHRDRWRALEGKKHRSALLAQWPSWFEFSGEKLQLETAFSLLSDYQGGYEQPGRLPPLLDALALEFFETVDFSDSYELARFLFQTKGLGSGSGDYYSPEKSDLAKVIEVRGGNPISLTSIYMLVGQRLGIDIQGCNFPGHFLGRTLVGNEVVLVDCFNRGRFLKAHEFLDLSSPSDAEVREIVHRPASVETILTRVLNNLIVAYDALENPGSSALMRALIRMMRLSALDFDGPR